jgi:hypothetical protein
VVLKDLRLARQVAAQAVPVFPGRGRVQAGRAAVWGGPRGRAGAHARGVWDRERERLLRQASGIERDCGGRAGLLAVIEIEFLSRIAGHAVHCGESGCAAWLAWGIGQVGGLRAVFGALGGSWQSVPPGYARALAEIVRQGA